MMQIPILFFVLILFTLSSCTQKEEEEEPDYDNIVMLDEEDEWTPGGERDEKAIADLGPQEFIILDPELKTENVFEDPR